MSFLLTSKPMAQNRWSNHPRMDIHLQDPSNKWMTYSSESKPSIYSILPLRTLYQCGVHIEWLMIGLTYLDAGTCKGTSWGRPSRNPEKQYLNISEIKQVHLNSTPAIVLV